MWKSAFSFAGNAAGRVESCEKMHYLCTVKDENSHEMQSKPSEAYVAPQQEQPGLSL